MSYELYQESDKDDGYLGYLATNSGWDDAANILEENGGPNLKQLAVAGTTDNPQQAAGELAKLLVSSQLDPEVKNVLSNLRSLLLKAQGTVTVCQ